ncbi:MAG: sensor histidine kinase [Acetobacteraceae bacterium]
MARARKPSSPAAARSLSFRVLVVTVAVVLLAEVLVLLPSLGRERHIWLREHVVQAEIAALAVAAAPHGMVDMRTRDELLRLSGTEAIRLDEPGRSILALAPHPGLMADRHANLDREDMLVGIERALATLIATRPHQILVTSASPLRPGTRVELVVRSTALARHLEAYARHIAWLSLLIATVTGALVYLTLHLVLVRPMRRLTRAIAEFRTDPEASVPLDPGTVTWLADDEMAVAGRELAAMQRELRAALWRNARLAALGTAVAKLSHDLRGILASALMVADRLQGSADPPVQRAGVLLVQAVERAVELVAHTLDFAREGRPALTLRTLPLAPLLAEAGESLRAGGAPLTVVNEVAPDLVVAVDRGQFARVLANLLRNAAEAGARRVTMTAVAEPERVRITLADDGPGMAEAAQANLFRPFAGSGRAGGTGLGLAIARDLMRAHGGDIALLETGPAGTVFQLTLPAAPPPAPAAVGV